MDWSAFFSQDRPQMRADSLKWQRYAGRDILPLWLADMEFATAPSVVQALNDQLSAGVYGYPQVSESLVSAVIAHCQQRYDWQIEAEWLVWLPALVPALHLACRSLANEGEGVLSFTPVYPPFLTAPRLQHRRLQPVPLRYDHLCWQLDFDALQQATTAQSRLLLLCHPHNPVGRAWTEAELQSLADWAQARDLWVCSDEVHADLLWDGRRHRPFASLSKDAEQRSVTLMSASKSFNLAGLGCAWAIIPNAELRLRFQRERRGLVPEPAWPGLIATQAALRDQSGWLPAVCQQLQQNRDLLQSQLAACSFDLAPIEATYLAFIDIRQLKLESPQAFFEQAGLGLGQGADFGLPGFVRLNFACPPAMLQQALDRWQQAISLL